MFPYGLLRVPAALAALKIVAATMPNGDRVQSTFQDISGSVVAVVVTKDAQTGVVKRNVTMVKPATYTWRIEEERRSVVLPAPGRPMTPPRYVYALSGWLDATGSSSAPPRPTQIFRFYASTRKAAEDLRERLKKGLRN